ncbi:arylsulfatase [Mariniblastus sp.]|nr:arylsulfatase [Mariniblastus sp.]MDB4755934.1 arylsulfatase [Mariniblastus sp.]
MKNIAAFILIGCVHSISTEAYDQPNVLLILADDMGVDSVSALNEKMGLKTPAIDRLVLDGMSFSDAHSTSAVCTPTRYSVLTGRYNWRSRLKRGIVHQWERPLIKNQRITLADMFNKKDYRTACIGKWHLGWLWPKKGGGTTEKLQEIDFTKTIRGGPNDHGFDYYFGDDVPNWPPYAWRENDQLIGQLSSHMKAGALTGVAAGPSVPNWNFNAVLSEYSKRADAYIRQQAEEKQPFFLYVPLPSPHTPIAPHEKFQGKSGVGPYGDFLLQTDDVVATLMKALEDSGQKNNTLVIFTCDNGTSPQAKFQQLDAAGVHLNEHWRGWKADAFEGGHRVPFVVQWPGKIQAGSHSTETITLADIMATCADVIGYQLPHDAGEDSVSLLPTWQGVPRSKPLHELVIHHSVSGHFAVRKGKWKLLFCHGSGGWSPPREAAAIKQKLPALQLYDLQQDPGETKNLHADYPDVVKNLRDELRRVIERGRSTPGPAVANDGGQLWWKGLPWKKAS